MFGKNSLRQFETNYVSKVTYNLYLQNKKNHRLQPASNTSFESYDLIGLKKETLAPSYRPATIHFYTA